MKKHIYIAYTGGTFGMEPGEHGLVPAAGLRDKIAQVIPPSGQGALPAWTLHEYPQLIDSSMAQPQDWLAMAADIASRYDDYDGFVIIHGTDTMAYSAAALAFALQGLAKPVILTGSQQPWGTVNSDALDNLTGALLMAAHTGVPEVGLYFNGQLLRGNRSTKASSTALNAFASPNYPSLATLAADSTQPVVNQQALLPVATQANFQLQQPVLNNLLVLQLHPGLQAAQLERLLAVPTDALILKSFGAGNAPTQLPRFVDVIAQVIERGVMVINLSQCYQGRVEPGRYAAGTPLVEAGVLSGYDLTVEAATTKLYYLWSQGLDAVALRTAWQQPCVGEFSLMTTAADDF